jgi:uncharacterized protein (TIGR03545 family)
MKDVIRWRGLAFFGLFTALFGLFWFFFIDGFIARTIENQGSALVGARVELGAADLTLFPAGLQLTRLQITNPEQPMRNAVEIDRLAMSIDPLQLLRRKIIIEEMALEGLRPDTPRQKSGAIAKYRHRQEAETADAAQKGIKLPSLQIPSVQEVLAKEQLTSLTLVEDYQDRIKADRLQWQQRLAELPDQAKLAAYKERLRKIKASRGLPGLLGGAAELLAVKKELQTDLDRLQAARKGFAAEAAAYQQRLAVLKKAPRRDIDRLLGKYSLSGKGLTNLSSLILGARIGNILDQALGWYAKAQPLLTRLKKKAGATELVKPVRGKGVWVRFEEQRPLPDFLIRKIAATVEITAGRFTGTIMNVTPDQDILGAPLTFNFAGQALPGVRAISLDGILNHVKPDQSRDTMNLAISEFALHDEVLSRSENLPVTIRSGLADLTARAVIQPRDIVAEVRASLKAADLATTPPQEGDAIARALAGALAEVHDITMTAQVRGTMADYRLELSSNLDQILKQAAAKTIKEQTAGFARELREGIMAKVDGPLAAATTSFTDFAGIDKELATRLQTGTNLLR